MKVSSSIIIATFVFCLLADAKAQTHLFRLLDSEGRPYMSATKGQFGGHKRLKIYGRLDCPSALRWLKRGHYKKHRVFFATEADAISAGFRPCAICMPEEYKKWKRRKLIKDGNPESKVPGDDM